MVQARIVDAARQAFAERGWAGTTMRAVARDAGVSSRLIRYYFADKTELLEATLSPPAGFVEGIAAAAAAPIHQRGAAIVTQMFRSWENPHSAEVLRSVILTAAHVPLALERLQLVFRTSMVEAVSASLEGPDRDVRAGLVASQVIGLAMTRYVWRIEPLASMSADDLVRYVAPTVQRYLNHQLPAATKGRLAPRSFTASATRATPGPPPVADESPAPGRGPRGRHTGPG